MTTRRRRWYAALSGVSSSLLVVLGTVGFVLAELFLVDGDVIVLENAATKWWLGPIYLVLNVAFTIAYAATVYRALRARRHHEPPANLCRWSILCASVGAVEVVLAVLLGVAALIWVGATF